MAQNTETEELLDDIDDRLERLRQQFQLYFQGLDKRPPTDERDRLKTLILRSRGESRRWSTKDRFRISTLHQKFLSYNRMWSRTLKEIEDGTYFRHRNKLKRKKAQEETAPPGSPAPIDLPTAPPRAAAAGAAGGPGSLSDDRMRRLYNVYMQAKKRTGEKTNLSYDSLKKQLQKQIPAIKKRHKCRDVDFKVVLKNGKAMLKAVPK